MEGLLGKGRRASPTWGASVWGPGAVSFLELSGVSPGLSLSPRASSPHLPPTFPPPPHFKGLGPRTSIVYYPVGTTLPLDGEARVSRGAPTGGTFQSLPGPPACPGPHPSWAGFLPRILVLAWPGQPPGPLWSVVASCPASPAHPEPRSCTSLPSTLC